MIPVEKIIVRCIGIAAGAVEVEVPVGIWPAVEECLSGFAGIGRADFAQGPWRVVLATCVDDEVDSSASHYGDYDDTHVWRQIDGARRVVRLTAAAASAYAPIHVVRIVRTLLRLDASQRDPSALFLHAGMVSWQGQGIALVGGKRSGKTSVAIAATAAGAGFVSNDDLSLHRGPDGLVGVGWPRSVSIRLDTLEPLGLTLPAKSAHPANTHRDEAQLLMPYEIGRMLGSRVTPDAPLRAVLFPSFGADDTSTLRRLDPDEAAERLLANLLTPPVKDDELATWFELPSAEELSTRARQVAAVVPAFELCQTLAQLACRPELARICDQAVAGR